jgi:hypothetical protein
MRLLFPVAMILATNGASLSAKAPPLQKPGSDCPGATSEWVRHGTGRYSEPTKPRKLAQLPPADAYAAVYRLDERGCMVPVKFREVRR